MPPSDRRRPPSARPGGPSYRTRRLAALGILVVIIVVVYSAVRAATEYFGDDGDASTEVAAESPVDVEEVATVEQGATVEPAANEGAGSGDAGSATTLAPDAAAESTVPPTTGERASDTGPITPDNPAKVLIIGDSDAGTFGPYLQTLLDGTQHAESTLDYKVSSGLARPDFFDWPAEAESKIAEINPDIVVATFGGNDAQGLSVESGEFIVGDPVANEAEWTEEYQRRAGDMMDLLGSDGRTLIWVGIPNDDNPDVTARMAVQDQAAKAAAAERPEVVFVDTWARFSGRDGNWAEYVIDPRDGEGKDVRAGDGFHLNETGAEILALDIAQEVRDRLRELGAQI